MSNGDRRIKKVVIVGGGTAGWMTAASLAAHFKNIPISIVLIESSTIGTVGVGEATIPTIRQFYRKLGISDQEIIHATNATCKLGIEFQDWYKIGSSFLHPFGLFGQAARGIPFQQFWAKYSTYEGVGDLAEYSLAVMMAKSGKMAMPLGNPPSSLSVFDWALHFDAKLFADFLKRYSLSQGVQHVDAVIETVELNSSTGNIEKLKLDTGTDLDGELFIDCSGMTGLLISKALGVGYEDWSENLLCDRACAVQTAHVQMPPPPPPPYTLSKAYSCGWRWEIPLQTRLGNGIVFSSQFSSDDEVKDLLLKEVKGEPMAEPRIIKFTPGMRELAWHKNCIAIGLSSGFIEPLESTSIALIEVGIEKLIKYFPDKSLNPVLIKEFNSNTREEYERVRDFIILHYKATQRDDSELWNYCRNMRVPDALQHKIDMYKHQAHIVKYPREVFQMPSWLAMFDGYGIRPDDYSPMVDQFEEGYMLGVLKQMREAIRGSLERAPSHEEFLAEGNNSMRREQLR